MQIGGEVTQCLWSDLLILNLEYVKETTVLLPIGGEVTQCLWSDLLILNLEYVKETTVLLPIGGEVTQCLWSDLLILNLEYVKETTTLLAIGGEVTQCLWSGLLINNNFAHPMHERAKTEQANNRSENPHEDGVELVTEEGMLSEIHTDNSHILTFKPVFLITA